jgi:hypothetical protein|tara:strand:- start:2160 stop:2432 length:273 start_codon:yes stop_codon:yes gene_type:complete
LNKRKLKDINRHTEFLFKEWVKTLVSEEEALKVDDAEYRDLVPDEYHSLVEGTLRLSPNSPRWIKKKLKSICINNPSVAIKSLTLEDLNV